MGVVTRVLDSSALIAMIVDEPGGSVVRDLLQEPDSVAVVHPVNLCEVYYDMLKRGGPSQAESALQELDALGLRRARRISLDFIRRVAALKSARKVSLADCFCIVLTVDVNGVLVTCDRHELERVAADGVCDVQFIR